MTANPLLPCPFCGSAKVEFGYRGFAEPIYYVLCNVCGAQTTGLSNPDTPVERWQRRADETDVPHSVAWLYEQLSNCREAMSESLRNGGRTDWRQYIDALDAILLRRTSEKTDEVSK